MERTLGNSSTERHHRSAARLFHREDVQHPASPGVGCPSCQTLGQSRRLPICGDRTPAVWALPQSGGVCARRRRSVRPCATRMRPHPSIAQTPSAGFACPRPLLTSNVRRHQNMPSRRELLALLVLGGFCIRGICAEAGIRIAGWGALTFLLPEGWRVQGGSESPPSLTLVPSGERTLELRILPFTSPQAGVPPHTPESLRAMAEENAKFRARDSSEAALAVRESRAGDAFVYYYSFTDRAPKPGFGISRKGLQELQAIRSRSWFAARTLRRN